jgi:hypothetical protein
MKLSPTGEELVSQLYSLLEVKILILEMKPMVKFHDV